MAAARERVNNKATGGTGAQVGTKRLLAHAVFTPGQPGWLEHIDAALDLRPDSWKGYTIGDNTHKEMSRYPWRMDDEKVAYRGYEKFLSAGIKNVCVHKGLFPPSVEKSVPNLRGYVDVSDVGQAAKDWPELNFIIYHSGYRFVGDITVDPALGLAEFERTGRVAWISDLAEIPEQYGVTNVYGDLGQVIAMTLVAQPRLCAAVMGILLRGLGPGRVCWGTDALWTGSPQWQIEGLRRLEIPNDMQSKYGFQALGPANGKVKSAIFSGNNARLYNIDLKKAELTVRHDEFAHMKARYEIEGAERSNLRYGYVIPRTWSTR